MFTGIIESLGKVKSIQEEGSNVHFEIESSLAKESYIDQSIAHNGVCLTVVSNTETSYVVTAIDETLKRSNLGELKLGDTINLERCMLPNTRMDGHMVQGHVDTVVQCQSVQALDGSWEYRFSLPADYSHLIVDKGSVSINGVSLTVVDPSDDSFGVAIIPYTFEHTNFKSFQAGHDVNIEFDIIGKYVAKQMAAINKKASL